MKLNRFQRAALSTTIATYLLIAIGGLVRASGAGLGCPDWPKCFGSWVPPIYAVDLPRGYDPALFNVVKTWTEYLNRLAGVMVGFLIFGTLLLAVKDHRRAPHILGPTVASFVLVAFEGWLGGMVVRSGLKPIILTLHLTFALIVVGLLLYATVCAFFPNGRPTSTLSTARKRVGLGALVVSFLTLVQIGLGAAVRGKVQTVAEGGTPRAEWLSKVGTLDIVHRNAAVITALAIMGLAWWIFTKLEPDRWLRRMASVSVVLVLVQGGAGLALADLGFPRVMQVVHLWAASLLLGALTVLFLLVYRQEGSGGASKAESIGSAALQG